MNPAALPAPHRLQCHPATPAGLPLDVSAVVNWTRDGLQLRYEVIGNMAGLRIPVTAAPGPADGLWQHTCLETFVAAEGEAAYREFNFSPSGQWAAYRFAAERLRDATAASALPAPVMQLAITPAQLSLAVDLPRAALPNRCFELALCAVIEESSGRLSYWALQHPCERPDFHHPAGRTLRLALPAN